MAGRGAGRTKGTAHLDGSALQPNAIGRPGLSRRSHVRATVRLAAPLAIAQLAATVMGLTDTAMLGWLGADALAAGGLAINLFITLVLMLGGVLTAVGVLVAYARGSGEARIPELYRSGLLLALLLSVPGFAALSFGEGLLLAIGEPPELARATGAYLDVLRWGVPGAVLDIGLMRAFLPAIGQGRLLLWVSLAAVLVNAGLAWVLMFGAFGSPGFGMAGSAAATALSLSGISAALLTLLHLHPALRRHVSPGRARRATLIEMLRLGLPVGATYAVETGLFLATGLLTGLLGAAALGAHQIALSVASTAFMVPLAVAQAANVRVGGYMGAGRRADARRAGLVAIGLGGAFMAAAGLLLLALPETIAGLFVSPAVPANREAFAIAVSLLGVAAAFAVVDGVQSVAIGSLRGLKDTRVPFAVAALGYWGVGFPLAYAAAFWLGWGAVGLWLGLAGGLAVVAVAATWRFVVLSRGDQSPARP